MLNLLRTIESDPTIDVVESEHELWFRGVEFFTARPDKEWSLTDCISFVIMSDRGITDALTADVHFRQAGFNALLRE